MKYKVKKPIQPRPGLMLKPGDEADENAIGEKLKSFTRTGAVEPIGIPPKLEKQRVEVETTQATEEEETEEAEKPRRRRRRKKGGE